MYIILQKILRFFLLFGVLAASTPYVPVTINIDKIPLPAALTLIAKWQKRDLVLSPDIHGWVALHFIQTNPEDIFNLLLRINKLTVEQIGNVLYVMPVAKRHHAVTEGSLLSDNSPIITSIWRLRYVSVNEIANYLRQVPRQWLTDKGQIQIDMKTNTLFLKEHKSNLPNIKKLIKTLDVPIQQILIEARLASVDVDYEHMLGINFMNNRQLSLPRDSNSGSIILAKLIDNLLDVKLASLENAGHGELISKPSLFTANQQTAIIETGEDIPYQQVTASGATTVVFKKAVLSLKVTPQILPDNKVLLKLYISQDRPSSLSVLGVPAITTRRIVTNVILPNAHTVVLGGIYETSKQGNISTVPFLGNIPVLAWLFQFKQQRHSKRELLIFVTPKIIRNNP